MKIKVGLNTEKIGNPHGSSEAQKSWMLIYSHTDLLHLVPKIRFFPKGNKWIHDMIYSDSMVRAHRAEEVLQNVFKDIAMIWNGGDKRKIYHRYFTINRA